MEVIIETGFKLEKMLQYQYFIFKLIILGSSSQDGRSIKKDDQRKMSDSQQKNQRLTNQNNRKDQSKSSSRSNQNNNAAKPGQTNQRYERQKSQPQLGQDDSNAAPIIKGLNLMSFKINEYIVINNYIEIFYSRCCGNDK